MIILSLLITLFNNFYFDNYINHLLLSKKEKKVIDYFGKHLIKIEIC